MTHIVLVLTILLGQSGILFTSAIAQQSETPAVVETSSVTSTQTSPTQTLSTQISTTQISPDQTSPPQISPAQQPSATVPPADSQLDAQIESLLSKMNPADRVGQLFVVSFQGDDTRFNLNGENNGLSDAILQLIYAYRIGGVVLSPRNGNFTNAKGTNTPLQVATLVNQLQAAAYGIVLPENSELQPIPNEPWPPPNITSLERVVGIPPQNLPLLVGIEQMGDGINATALRQGGFTELPSPLAIGSTWNPELAQQIGEITGRELRAVGINLLLGPNLDVVDVPRSDAVGSLGQYSFGGNPFWVSRIGRAYIAGVHQGGEGQVATIAGHFPGQGDVDRLPDEEVATIQKSREDLDRLSLAPFVNVTIRPSSILSSGGSSFATDGLMSSHMRFTAIQGAGSGRATPLSLSPDLAGLLRLDRFKNWRDGGGIIMSGSLGAPAIRRSYDPDLKTFSARQIAQSAFSAGNDLLFLDRFALTDDWASQLSNIQVTIGFFHEQYTKDASFAAQVDAAVRRILRLKLRLYANSVGETGQSASLNAPMIPLSAVLVQNSSLSLFESETQEQARIAVSQVARESISLLYPDPSVQTDPLLSAPRAQDKVVIFTDSRLLHECADCTSEAAVGPDEIGKTIDLFYGEDSTGQLPASQVSNLTFADLNELLDAAQSAQEATPTVADTTTVSETATMPTAVATLPATIDPPESASDPNQLDKNAKNEKKIEEAQWLIFAMLDVDEESSPSSIALKRFLRQRSDQPEQKKIVVLALGPPYFLDTTEISKLTAYYGVYGRGREFIENAVRALFRSYAPIGAPAVDVPGTRFAKLSDRLQPDPQRKIPFRITQDGNPVVQNSIDSLNSEAVSASIESQGNDSVTLEIGPILDLNGNIVVDGTVVEVGVVSTNGTTSSDALQLATTNGVATREITLDESLNLNFTARTGKATSGEPINLIVRLVTPVVAATVIVTDNSAANGGISSTNVLSPTESQAIGVNESIPLVTSANPINAVTLVLSLLTISIVLSVLVLTQVRVLPRTILVNSMCWALICGLGSYIMYGYGWIPGTSWLADTLHILGAPIVVFIAMLVPLLWLQLRELVHIRVPYTE